MKFRLFFAALAAVAGAILLSAARIQPLAQDYVVVGESPDPQRVPLYNPSLIRLDSGRLVAAYMQSGKHTKQQSFSYIFTSDDRGVTWQKRATVSIGQARLFPAGKSLYFIGSAGLRIVKSDDNGVTWSEPSTLAKGQWHQTASNYWHANGCVYVALEKRVSDEIKAWSVGELAPILMRGRVDADLTKAENWTFASELSFGDALPGQKENHSQLNFFGVPFFPQDYPGRYDTAPKRGMAPMGWLETNVVQVPDPKHYWHDPSGHTFYLLMRAHTGGTGYAALAKAVEYPDGTIHTSLVQAPSGKHMLFLPLPGGQMRFHIVYDEPTKLYWLLSSQATDSMTRPELLPADRYNLPNNERHRMVLHFSKNLVDWCFAGLVATGATPGQARHYAAMAIDGDDLVILSRSGDARAKNAHDGNLITFHRVPQFRSLVY